MFSINGDWWRILLVSSNHPALRRKNGSFTIGACINNNKTIYIAENLTSQQFRKVLCHEITHAAMFSYNVSLTIQEEELLADLIASYGQEIIDITNELFYRIKKRGIY